MGCRLHGPACDTAWGLDRGHADSLRPYTLEELATRLECPHFYAYPTAEEYAEGFHLWRALRRDCRPTAAEERVLWEGLEERIEEVRGVAHPREE